jgi:hypothetical protein
LLKYEIKEITSTRFPNLRDWIGMKFLQNVQRDLFVWAYCAENLILSVW